MTRLNSERRRPEVTLLRKRKGKLGGGNGSWPQAGIFDVAYVAYIEIFTLLELATSLTKFFPDEKKYCGESLGGLLCC